MVFIIVGAGFQPARFCLHWFVGGGLSARPFPYLSPTTFKIPLDNKNDIHKCETG